jgi:hypothetical protein
MLHQPGTPTLSDARPPSVGLLSDHTRPDHLSRNRCGACAFFVFVFISLSFVAFLRRSFSWTMGINGLSPGDTAANGNHSRSNGLPRSDQPLHNDSSKSWIVQKFGGTSVGKVPEQIAEGIVSGHLAEHRLAIVCSARSSDTKLAGTTNRRVIPSRLFCDLQLTRNQTPPCCPRSREAQ